MKHQKFYDEYWGEHEQPVCWRHIQTIEFLHQIKPQNILDLGAGDGLLLKMIKDQGMTSEGIEFSEKGLKNISQMGLKATKSDLTDPPLPFDEGQFDCVICLDVLEHLYHPEQVLQEMHRLTSKYIIIGVPNFNSVTARVQVLFGQRPENNKPRQGHLYWMNKKVLSGLLQDNEFRTVKSAGNTILERYKFTIPLQRTLPSLFSLSFVILAEKA